MFVKLHMHTAFFFFNDTATTEIYTLSLHDALPIYRAGDAAEISCWRHRIGWISSHSLGDRKSTRLNSSHITISYAVFCLKKKKNIRPKLENEITQYCGNRGYLSVSMLHYDFQLIKV